MKYGDRYFDLRGLSEYSSLSVRTLRKYLGMIPHYRIGGKLLVKKSEFDKYLEHWCLCKGAVRTPLYSDDSRHLWTLDSEFKQAGS